MPREAAHNPKVAGSNPAPATKFSRPHRYLAGGAAVFCVVLRTRWSRSGPAAEFRNSYHVLAVRAARPFWRFRHQLCPDLVQEIINITSRLDKMPSLGVSSSG